MNYAIFSFENLLFSLNNFDLLNLFYCFSRRDLRTHASHLINFPRNMRNLSQKNIDILTSTKFRQTVAEITAKLVWPTLIKNEQISSFSKKDPIVLLAYNVEIWKDALIKINGYITDALIYMPKGYLVPWLTTNESKDLFLSVGNLGIKTNNLRGIIEAVDKMRCEEDFINKCSHTQIDFYRKWFHSRANLKSESLEIITSQQNTDTSHYSSPPLSYNNYYDFENQVDAMADMSCFLKKLDLIDQRILVLRYHGYTYKEIAEIIGFTTHSAVLKRINNIAILYEHFTE